MRSIGPGLGPWTPEVKKQRDFYHFTPGAPICHKECGWYVLEKRIERGYLKPYDAVADYDAYLCSVFHLDENVFHYVTGLGDDKAGMFPFLR